MNINHSRAFCLLIFFSALIFCICTDARHYDNKSRCSYLLTYLHYSANTETVQWPYIRTSYLDQRRSLELSFLWTETSQNSSWQQQHEIHPRHRVRQLRTLFVFSTDKHSINYWINCSKNKHKTVSCELLFLLKKWNRLAFQVEHTF